MANQSNQLLLPNSPLQPFFESFFQVYERKKLYDITCANSSPEKGWQLFSEWDKKMNEFDRKYPVPDILKFVQQYLDVDGKFTISSEPSSSFQVVCNIMYQMAAKHGCSLKKDVPEVWKMPLRIMAAYESFPSAQDSNLTALEIPDAHRQQIEELSTIILATSSTFPNISSSSLNNLNPVPSPHHSIDIQGSQVNESSADINNIPLSPAASNEPTKLALATFASIVELVSTLSNFALNHPSLRAKEHQILMYIVLINSTIAFLLSSTALLLYAKMPVAAKMIMKVAFLFGAFGYMGIVGLLMPPTIMLPFTFSAFVVCFLIFTIAT